MRLSIATILLFSIVLTAINGLRFKDITSKSGLPSKSMKQKKYGGACITDLDGDGFPDIILLHHTQCCGTIHFNNNPKSAKFTQSSYRFWWDAHAIIPFYPTPSFKAPLVAVSIGGNRGTIKTVPYTLSINPLTRKVTENKKSVFPTSVGGRGRGVLFTELRRKGSGDGRQTGLVLNAPSKGSNIHHHAIEWDFKKRMFSKRGRLLGGFATEGNYHGALTDIDNDGMMEIITIEHMRMYNVTSNFQLKQISSKVKIPRDYTNTKWKGLKGVSGIAEIDYNNDGWWDLYVTRSSLGDLKWLRSRSSEFNSISDVLLTNRNGRFYTDKQFKGVLSGSNRGMAAGDFNNDGYIDLYVSCQSTSNTDYLLMNDKGSGRFTISKMKRVTSGPGDMATAFDVDNDGMLDLLVSSGDWHNTNQGGAFSILRNEGAGVSKNYIKVRVRSSPNGRVSNLHAVVKVKCQGIKGIMMRRVGGSIGVNTGVSVLDNVHFGLGNAKKVDWVLITWTNGQRKRFNNVRTRTTVTAGK